ncbi:MAG: DEAD/DEAH box helicase [Anaerolineales bacterium]|nr:DEAD/DEAH box helicase [Anaerolineales bacterium]
MRTLVALDLETTGLDPARDAILEIGALRFRGARIEKSYSQLVNPGRPIPSFITQLTGINDSMVADAPRLSAVLGDLAELIGDAPVIGHNIAFDLAFLQRRGSLADALGIDTFDLASVMLPAIGRYGLAAIARQLGIPVPTSHRALADAQTTHQVFLQMVERARDLPRSILEEIVLLGENVEWGGGWLFEEALSERPASDPHASPRLTSSRLLRAAEPEPAPGLQPRDPLIPLDVEELASTLEPGGPFAQRFPGYEHRREQVSMLRAVAQALSDGKHLMVEAGTGTGKSMAYLIPALEWANVNGQRVVVSTNTINLQDQLRNKDVPDLRLALGQDYQVSILKGRANYLCPRRLDAARHLGPRSPEEMRLLAKLLVWLSGGGSGDRTDLSLAGPAEAASWGRLSADSDECTAESCQAYAEGTCPYFQARRAAEQAHLVVVNHALLLADIVTGNRVIPEYDYLIVDEAHHLESAATKGLSLQVTEAELHRVLSEITAPHSGLLAMVRTEAKHLGSESGAVVRAVHACSDDGAAAKDLVARLFSALAGFMTERREGQEISPFGQQERVLPSTRTLVSWAEVERVWEDLRGILLRLAKQLAEISQVLEDSLAGQSDLQEDLVVSLRTSSRAVASQHSSLEAFVFEPDAQTIYWIEIQPSGTRMSLNAAPLEVGPLVQRHLWHAKSSVILTSATLTTAGSFDYLRGRLKAEDAEELAVDSPFDYETSTLLYLVNDIPEPFDRQAYQRVMEQGLVSLGRATRGRMLVLFTSHDQLRRTASAISAPLSTEGILVLDQSEGASRTALLEQFRTTEQAVLLGTRSFWEGVDVPGEALSVLAIARLPFDVPTDPIIASRAESFEAPFDEYHVPEAILRFRQGFGRLIRTRSDRGVVVCFDRRILTKRYGQAFLSSLPHCTQRAGPMSDLPSAASRWLGS